MNETDRSKIIWCLTDILFRQKSNQGSNQLGQGAGHLIENALESCKHLPLDYVPTCLVEHPSKSIGAGGLFCWLIRDGYANFIFVKWPIQMVRWC
jgi:hypothetical protein